MAQKSLHKPNFVRVFLNLFIYLFFICTHRELREFLQSLELGLPHPLTRGGGGGGSQFGRGDRHCDTHENFKYFFWFDSCPRYH
jgi:hypothetical protein